jgi:hypothetical protein
MPIRYRWALRLLLALSFFAASELLLWGVRSYPQPLQSDTIVQLTLPIWMAFPAYLAIAAAVLDFAARFRSRDVFALLLLVGVYGLSQALLISPAIVLNELPLTLATHGLGAHGLAGLAALTLLLWIARPGRTRWLVMTTAVLGLVWGVWARYSPPYWIQGVPPNRVPSEESYFGTALMSAVVMWLAIIVAAWFASRIRQQAPAAPLDLRLTPLEAAAAALIHAALIAYHASRGQLEIIGLLLCLSLYGLCVLMLWFHKRAKGDTYSDAFLTFHPPWRWLGAGVSLFVIAAALGWQLPRGAGAADPVALITTVFTAFGVVWMPAVALVLGLRAFRRDTRALRL